MTERTVARLLDALGDADVVVPVVGGRMQWVTSAWRTRCRDRLAELFAGGERSIRGVVGSLRTVHLLDAPAPYRDVDTAADLERLVASVVSEGPEVT